MMPPTAQPEKPAEKQTSRLSQGGKNLLLLGLGATIISIITVFISLKLYHDSGDIYLDRSRPGFLPEKEEVEERDDNSSSYTFSDSGKITDEVIDEYLENLRTELDRLNDYSSDPFGSNPLSDQSLGL